VAAVTNVLRKWLAANWHRIALSALSVSVFVIVWHLFSAYLRATSPNLYAYVPPPSQVLDAFVTSFTVRDSTSGLYMWDHIWASMKRVVLGFGVAVGLALPIGLLMGSLRGAEAAGRPIVEMIRPIPPLAWIPLFLVVFGIVWGPVAIVTIGIFFPVLLSVIFGVRTVDPVLIDAARTLGAKRIHIFTKVVLPFTVPYFMTGVKVGLGIGWMCIVAAEMLGSVGGGVGYYIFSKAGSSQYDLMFAGMIVIGLLGTLTTGIAGFFEERLYRWVGMK
jgi:NitT/TauT family transport system permease protein